MKKITQTIVGYGHTPQGELYTVWRNTVDGYTVEYSQQIIGLDGYSFTTTSRYCPPIETTAEEMNKRIADAQTAKGDVS